MRRTCILVLLREFTRLVNLMPARNTKFETKSVVTTRYSLIYQLSGRVDMLFCVCEYSRQAWRACCSTNVPARLTQERHLCMQMQDSMRQIVVR